MQEVGPTDMELSTASPPSQLHRDSQVEGSDRRITNDLEESCEVEPADLSVEGVVDSAGGSVFPRPHLADSE